jgi:arginine decarboxylase
MFKSQNLFPSLNCYFLIAGHGEGVTPLNAFDNALLNAGIGNTNLVKLSSIIPPKSQKIDILSFPPGTIVPLAYSYKTSDMPGQIITSAVAVGVPEKEENPGLIMEYSTSGRKDVAEKIAVSMVEEGMKYRKWKLKSVYKISIEHTVERIGTSFAAVVLWHLNKIQPPRH